VNNRAKAEEIVRHARARRIIQGWLGLDQTLQCLYIDMISGFVKLEGRTGSLARAALQAYYDERAKSLPWNKWLDRDEKVDGYTGRPDTHDDYYIVIEPDKYHRDTYLRLQSPDGEIITLDVAYEDGEAVIDLPEEYLAYQVVEACSDIWGYGWLRSIWQWAQEPEGPYEQPVTERRYRRSSEGLELIAERTYSPDEANRLYLDLPAPDGPDEEEFEEDRGYEPPTFTPAIDLNTADAQAFIRQNDSEIEHLAQTMFDQSVADQMAYSQIRDIGTPPELDVPDELPVLLTGSYLTEGERYRVLQHLASRIRGLIPEHVLARLAKLDRNNREELYAILNQYGLALRYWDNVNIMTEACGLTEYVDLWFDELHEGDTRGHKQITTDLEIEQVAEKVLREYVEAPIIKLAVQDLEAKWKQNPKQFPAQEKVRTERRNGFVYFWLADPVDYRTLDVLYKLADLDIPGPQLHAHLPFVQRRVIDLIMSGSDISGAYKLAREEANRIRRQRRQPKGQVQIIGYENHRFLVETGRNPARLHPGALDHVVVVPTDELRKILCQALNEERSIEGPIHRAYKRLFGGRNA
jgi:hypothetical protein